MSSKVTGLSIGIALILTTIYASTFTVGEAEMAFIVEFGEIKGDVITTPGSHWKKPFIQEVRRLDARVLTWNGDIEQIPTVGREFVMVDTTAHWRIANPRLFLESVHDERGARSHLDDVLDSIVRDKISGAKLEEIIRSPDWQAYSGVISEADATRSGADIERTPDRGRQDLERDILAAAQALMPSYGIELLDVHIQRVNYIASVRRQVEDRMISERESIAEKFRSEGRGRSEEILGEMQREVQAIRSDALRKGEEIRGAADAEVTGIYGRAYGQNPEFYGFLETLEVYRETMGANTTLMFSANSDFFRYLQSAKAK